MIVPTNILNCAGRAHTEEGDNSHQIQYRTALVWISIGCTKYLLVVYEVDVGDERSRKRGHLSCETAALQTTRCLQQ